MKRFLLVCLIATAGLLPAVAFQFSPIVADFEPSGSAARRTFRLTNPAEDAIPVEITVYRRTMNEAGEDRLEESRDFVVFPSQVILQGGSSQVVRVQYVGPSSLDAEVAYRIIAEQLPVDLQSQAEGGARLNLLFRYVGSIYVVPPGVRAAVEVESVERVSREGRPAVALTLYNAGTAHTLLEDLQVELATAPFPGAPDAVALGRVALEAMVNQNILAGTRRRFILPLPSELALTSGRLYARISYSPTR